MAMYTQRLKDVLISYGGNYDFVNGACVIDGAEHIGLLGYPIFDLEYREHLNGLIFNRYMNEEIGLETPEMFRAAVMRTMNENMPVFNKLYESTRLEFDPLSTVNIKTFSASTGSNNETASATSSQDSETKSGTRAISSDYPQTQLAANKDYATAGSDTNAVTDGTTTSDQSSTAGSDSHNENESHTSGYQGHTVALLDAYRASLINVDLMVLDSLSNLFIQLWDVPEQYTNRGTFNAYNPTIH